ncbi:unnamed protein product [Effrenium voratum]|uniref:Rieske domain-containing protein n=1 Tax=Effrenium voratum TaxID=2562239 RepID=A0AA36JDF6_9DINO|nr:unnamed protein product [Effrenium voratum]
MDEECSDLLLYKKHLEVIGPEVPEGFGQIYDRIDASYLKEIPGVRQKMANCGRWAFLGRSPIGEGQGRPYLWRQHHEWKLAVVGEVTSRYHCHAPSMPTLAGAFSPWKRHKSSTPVDFKVIWREGLEEEADLPAPIQPSSNLKLCENKMQELYERGYTVLRGVVGAEEVRQALRLSELLIHALAAAALHAAPGWISEVLAPGCEGHNLRVRLAKAPEFEKLLQPLLPLARQLFQESPKIPHACQLAVVPPDGRPGEPNEGGDDTKQEYHLDGRGQLPNNMALLLGVGLTALPPAHCKSWGAFACHPGSHRNSALHRQYGDQHKGLVAPMDLGAAEHVRCAPGDVMLCHPLLAHRRSENWRLGELGSHLTKELPDEIAGVLQDPAYCWVPTEIQRCSDLVDGHQWITSFEEKLKAQPEQGAGRSLRSLRATLSEGDAPQFWGPTPPARSRNQVLRSMQPPATKVVLPTKPATEVLFWFNVGPGRDNRDRVYVTEARCPHQGMCLMSAELKDVEDLADNRRGMVRCPHHNKTFDLATGESPGNAETLKTYLCRFEGGRFYAKDVEMVDAEPDQKRARFDALPSPVLNTVRTSRILGRNRTLG